jgi:tRNA nucleotidyltransferase (CCA-adding enzyme)
MQEAREQAAPAQAVSAEGALGQAASAQVAEGASAEEMSTEGVSETVRMRLPEQPGGPQLLALAAAHPDTELELVGGAVRDLLLGREPRELDVVVDGDAIALARILASQLGTEATVHERFGTAVVAHAGARVDFATRRAESYPAPGALPQVRAGSASEDLLRRDFTVNAIAVGLNGPRPWRLRGAPHACADLRARLLRVLHDHSFIEDPTRLLRLARYQARLDFAVERHTAALAAEALQSGALASVSGARLGAELRLALEEADAPSALGALQELDVLAALHPRLRHDPELVARALELLPADGSRPALLLAALLLPLLMTDRRGAQPKPGDTRLRRESPFRPAGGTQPGGLGRPPRHPRGADGHPQAEAQALLDRLEFSVGERELALRSALEAVRLLSELPDCARPAELYQAAHNSPPEGVALAGALAGNPQAAAAARRWLGELRHVRLQITGADLLAAGIPEGPEVGRRLQATLLLRLDGELAQGPEAELRAALASELPRA